ncbi:MAG: T9SS type A sorting domain-containing protein [Flavobacteriales bacterium]
MKEEESAFSLHPNPAEQRVEVRIKGNKGSEDRFRILSPEGQIVRSFSKEADRFKISVNSLSNRLYIVEWKKGTGEPRHKILLVR